MPNPRNPRDDDQWPNIRQIVHEIPAGAPLVGPRVQRLHDHGNAIRDRPAKDRSHRSRSAEGDRLWKSQIRRCCPWQTARRRYSWAARWWQKGATISSKRHAIENRSYSGRIWRTFGIWHASSSKRKQPSRFKMRRNLPRQSNNFWSIRNERRNLAITRTPSFLNTEGQPTAYCSFFNRSGRAGEPRFSIPGSGSREAVYLRNSADAAPESSGNQRWKSDGGRKWQNTDRHRAGTGISGKGIPPGDFVTRLRPD